MARAVAIGTGVLVLAALAATGAGSAPAHSPPGHIAFAKVRDGWGAIWTMNAFGTGLRRLTPPRPAGSKAAGSSDPAWTLTGTKIAFVSTGQALRRDAADEEIWTMRADSGGKRRLTDNRLADEHPAWSPDGTHIVFVRSQDGGLGSLYVMDDSGGAVRRLTNGRYDGSPAWSPDGREIAFQRSRREQSGLSSPGVWVIPATGGQAELLARDGAEPAWSLDARRLAFSSRRDHFGTTCVKGTCVVSSELYTMDADGSHQERETSTKADERSPSWSPDGIWLGFSSDLGDRTKHVYSVWVLSLVPPELIRATVGPGQDVAPAWGL